MKRLIFSLLLFSIYTTLNAQDTREIETDRPDQTETPVLVPKKYFQAEIGFTKENQGNKNYLLLVPTALLKYGISKRAELRLEASYQSQYLHLIPNPITIKGFAPIEIGTKIALLEEKGARPKTSLIAHLGLSFLSSDEFKPNEPVASFRFAMQNTLSHTVSLGYNLGLEWEGESSSPKFAYTFAPGLNLSERWYTYIEAYGFIGKEDAHDHNIDAGIAYLVTRNMKVDLSGGIGLSKASNPNFISLGFSFRLPTSRK